MIATERKYQKPKVGELLRMYNGEFYDLDGYQHMVKSVAKKAETWPGYFDQKFWFVITNLLKVSGGVGKREKTFIVSTEGSVIPLEKSWRYQ